MAKANIFSGPAARPAWDQDTGHSTNKSFTFQYVSQGASQEITLAVNPENFTQTEPSRITVTQTKGGAFVDNFGPGLKTISIVGITGYAQRKDPMTGTKISGHDHFIALRKMYRDWLNQYNLANSNVSLRFYNWSDDESYEIVINNFTLQRTVGRPLLYQYNIQMTCLKDLSKPEREQDNVTNILTQPRDRASLINQSLSNSSSFLGNVVSGSTQNLSDAVKSWGKNVAQGLQFFDTISSAFKTVSSVLDDVKSLGSNLNTFVNGVTSFITQPFSLVQDLTSSLNDIAVQASALYDIPHDIVREIRNMVCGIVALPESLFQGFTNPSLFEGASNCGTTLGIPEAAVANYGNSFTSTAPVPSQANISQAFDVPTPTITLKTDPLKVTGVFLVTDVSRTGINYMDSYHGRDVTLYSVPKGAVVVDYVVQQPTAQSMIQLQAAFSYIVRSGDTLVRIALNALGDPTLWKEIALFNGLDYPYIVEDEPNFRKEIYATGKVTFYRATGSPGVVPIPKGTAVWVPVYRGTNRIDFVTTEDAFLDLMQAQVEVPIIAVHYGDIGNVASGEITGFSLTGIASISNTDTTTGGKVWKVAFVGDLIQIPTTNKITTSIVVPSVLNYDSLFGVDIWINKDGELDFSVEFAKDLARVFGVENLSQALMDRIKTSKGFYPYYANYGTNLPLYIGKKGTLNWYALIKIDIKGSVMLDPRISSIKEFQMVIDGDDVEMSFDAIPINEQSSLPINLII